MDLTKTQLLARTSSVEMVNANVQILHGASLKVTSVTTTTTAETFPTKVAKFAGLNVRLATDSAVFQQGVDVSPRDTSVTETMTAETIRTKTSNIVPAESAVQATASVQTAIDVLMKTTSAMETMTVEICPMKIQPNVLL